MYAIYSSTTSSISLGLRTLYAYRSRLMDARSLAFRFVSFMIVDDHHTNSLEIDSMPKRSWWLGRSAHRKHINGRCLVCQPEYQNRTRYSVSPPKARQPTCMHTQSAILGQRNEVIYFMFELIECLPLGSQSMRELSSSRMLGGRKQQNTRPTKRMPTLVFCMFCRNIIESLDINGTKMFSWMQISWQGMQALDFRNQHKSSFPAKLSGENYISLVCVCILNSIQHRYGQPLRQCLLIWITRISNICILQVNIRYTHILLWMAYI